MKIRQGRKNGHNLYLQAGPEPSDSDVCLGLIIDSQVADLMIDILNSHGEMDAGHLVHAVLSGYEIA